MRGWGEKGGGPREGVSLTLGNLRLPRWTRPNRTAARPPTAPPRGCSSPHRLWGVKPFCSTPCFYLFMVRTGAGAWMSALGRGEGSLWAKSPPVIFVSVLLSFFISFFLKKTRKKTQQQQKRKPVPLNKRHSGQQWILRTYRKTGISWCIPAGVSQITTSGRGEEDEDMYGKGLLHCSMFVLLSWHSYTFGSRIPVCKSFRRTWLENLILYVSQLHVITREEGKLQCQHRNL